MVESLDKSSLDFDKQICFCTGLREMFEVNYLRAKYNKRSAAPLMPSIFFFAFSSKVLNSGIKSCFDEVVFLDAACEECFSIHLRCLHLYFLLLFS